METVAQRFETTRQTLREQLGACIDRTRQAGVAFVSETREAGGELAQALKLEADAWTSLLGGKRTELLEKGPKVPELPARDVAALERRLLVSLRDILSRVDTRLQERLEESPALEAGEEPLDGYDELSAKAILGMLPELEPSLVAAVASYEAAHKGRKTILRATERQAA